MKERNNQPGTRMKVKMELEMHKAMETLFINIFLYYATLVSEVSMICSHLSA